MSTISLYDYDGICRMDFGALVCGVDEAGRGPLAGPVVAAAVILPPDARFDGLNDSKKLSEKTRRRLFEEITQRALAYRIEAVDADVIDKINILQATLLAMSRAVAALSPQPDLVLVDGNQLPALPDGCTGRKVVKGDATSACIAAASVLAKVSRDAMMGELALKYPGYGFEKHKGYPIRAHYEVIWEKGPSAVHRTSFLKNLGQKHAPKSPTHRQEIGRFGEEAARQVLLRDGYAILEQNYRLACGEIDLIAQKDGVIAFVEVKTRTGASREKPIDAVDYRKRQRIVNTAAQYLRSHRGHPIRFDVMEVYVSEREGGLQLLKTRHVKHVFAYDINTMKPIPYV